MTFDAFTTVPGRRAATILELDLDGCSRSYGVSPCTADLALKNLVLQSQTFPTSWNLLNLTVTQNTTNDPLLGALVADSLFETAVNSTHVINQVVTGIPSSDNYAWSKYIKTNGRHLFALYIYDQNDTLNFVQYEFDLNNQTIVSGAVGGNGVAVRPHLYPVGTDGFFRCGVVGIPNPSGGATDGIQVQIKMRDDTGATSYLGDINKGLIIFGAQLRDGVDLGKYAVTTTVAVDGMGVADDLCFNTFGTCQDTANYLKQVRTYRFADTHALPVDLIDAFPAIKSVKYGPTVLVPGGGFSVRGRVNISLQDFTASDAGVDDYAAERSYDASDQGTFFGKLFARNAFYEGRPMRVLEGYVDPPYDVGNFRTREYIIESVTGPDNNGRVQIVGKDILALALDKRAKAPTASTFTLRAAMTAGQTTLLPQTGEAVTIAAGDKHVRVDEEIIEIVSESPTDTLNVVRARGGTEGKAHNIDATVQECLTYENEPVIDVVDDLLQTYANVPSSFIPYTDWQAEETESLSGYDLETIISTPTGVQALLKEICECTLLDIWYSDTDQEIKLKLQTPFTEVTAADVINDDDHALADSLKITDKTGDRLSRVLIYYGIRNYAKDLKSPENFEFINFEIEADKESVNKYGDERIKTIFTRWMDSSNQTQVQLTSNRLLRRFGNTPQEIQFKVDAKDVTRLQTGGVFDFTSRIKQGTDGLPLTARFQVVQTTAIKIASQYQYKAIAFFADPQPDSLTISTNQVDYDVFVELGGPPGPVDVTLTINTGVDVDGSNTNPAITTEGMHPDSTIHIINNGDIRGFGGNGGVGGNATGFFDFEPGLGCIGGSNGTDGSNGQVGGDAISVHVDSITIDNTNGNIWAGAGGGGGGGADGIFSDFGGGGGGGGGIGTDTGNAGSGGTSTATGNGPGCGVTNTAGTAGTAGTTSAAGVNGVGGAAAGDGGDGGSDWGDDGQDGQDGSGASKGSGGAGGFAVRLNGASIVWEGGNTAAKVKGDVA